MDWYDSEDIAEMLLENDPETDPLTVRFTDLRQRVLALPGFEGNPSACSEAILEGIQMAWLAAYQDSQN